MTRILIPRIASLRSAFDYEKLPTTSPSSPPSSSSTGYLSRSASSSRSSSPSRSRTLRSSRPSAKAIVSLFLALVLFASYLSSHPIDTHHATAELQAQYEGAIEAVKDIYVDQKGKFVDNRPFIQNPWAEASCAEWDPAGAEEHDPPMCERAKLYRQVGRVLAREEKGKNDHPSYYFTRSANIATLTKLLECYLPTNHPDSRECKTRPAIINAYYWGGLTVAGGASGEAVWQESIIKLFQEEGMFVLFMGPYENWITVAELMPDVYRFIWADSYETVTCIADPRCIAREHYVPPKGTRDMSVTVPQDELGIIPVYRLVSIDYWGALPNGVAHSKDGWGVEHNDEWSWHPLGNRWISTPWPLPGHTHLAYSIEDHCLQQPYTPPTEKSNETLILAKVSSMSPTLLINWHTDQGEGNMHAFEARKAEETDYFHMPKAVPPEHLTKLSSAYPLITAAKEKEGAPIPAGIQAVGFQERDAYEELVAKSRVMLGIGFPPISPSIYTALCQGTPVVMPHFASAREAEGVSLKFEEGEWDMYSDSRYQHGPAAALGPPYVYSYYYKNYEQLEEAVALAHSTPIPRFIPADMRTSYARKTTQDFLKRNLESDFFDVIRANDERMPSIEGHVLEKCRERKKCKLDIPPGRKKGEEIEDRSMPGVQRNW